MYPLSVVSAAALLLPGGAGAAQRAAHAILAEGRFHSPRIPRPLHGALVAIGNVLEAPLRALQGLVGILGAAFPGGVAGVWIALAIALLALTLVLAARRSRSALAGEGTAPAAGSPERASELERAALLAEREGRFDDAVRLRFRAGLAHLTERHTIPSARTTPTVEVSRVLRSASFDSLARRFDEITYGSSPAAREDVEAARTEWPRVLGGGGRT